MGKRFGIGVIVLVIGIRSFSFVLLSPELEAVLVVFGGSLGAPALGLAEIIAAVAVGGLGLADVEGLFCFGVNAAGRGLILAAGVGLEDVGVLCGIEDAVVLVVGVAVVGLIQSLWEDKFVAPDDEVGRHFLLLFDEVELGLDVVDDLLLAVAVECQEAEFRLVSHFAARVHVYFEFFVLSDAEVVDAEVDLNLHACEVVDEEGEFVAHAFGEQFGVHVDDVGLGVLVAFLDVVGERVGHVLVEIVQREIFLVDVGHPDDVGAVDQLVLHLHRLLLLQQLLHARKALHVLDRDLPVGGGPLFEGVGVVLDLQDCLDHALCRTKLLLSFNQTITHWVYSIDAPKISTANVMFDQFYLMEEALSLSMHVRRNIFSLFFSSK